MNFISNNVFLVALLIVGFYCLFKFYLGPKYFKDFKFEMPVIDVPGQSKTAEVNPGNVKAEEVNPNEFAPDFTNTMFVEGTKQEQKTK